MAALEKIVKLDSKEIHLAASAATIGMYRAIFGGDFISDFDKARKDGDMEITNKIVYISAYHADKTIDPFDQWFEQFTISEYYDLLPEAIQLIADNFKPTSTAKKKVGRQRGKTLLHSLF